MKVIIEKNDTIRLVPNFGFNILEINIFNANQLHSGCSIYLANEYNVNAYFQYYVKYYIELKRRVDEQDPSIIVTPQQENSYKIMFGVLEKYLNSENRLYLELL